MPVSGPTGPRVSSSTSSNSLQPATNTAPAQPSAPAAPAAPARPSTFERGVDFVRGKAVTLALKEASSERSFGPNFTAGLVSGNFKVAERVALRNSPGFDALVKPDRRRSEYSASHPNSVWVQTRAMAGASAGFPLGLGGSLGFSGNVEISSIAAHDVTGARDIPGALAAQGKSMVVPFDAEALRNSKPAPGSEFMFRGSVGASAGIAVGQSQTFQLPGVTVTEGASVGLSASASDTFSKNVKVLEDGKVYVQVMRDDAVSGGVSAGFSATTTVTADDSLTGLAERGANQVTRQVERRLGASANAWGTLSAGSKVMGAAVLDLNNPAHRTAYDAIMHATPGAAADYIKTNHLGPEYTETRTGSNVGVAVNFGSDSLLSLSTARGTTNGTVVETDGTTELRETTFDRTVGGFLPRLFEGEERTVSVRAGEVVRGGVSERAAVATLNVKDPRLKQDEIDQLGRFSKALGTPLSNLPSVAAGKSNAGEATYTAQLALTDANIDKLSTWSKDDLLLAMANARKDLDGSTKLPPWFSKPNRFNYYKEAAAYPQNSPDSGGTNNLRGDYSQEFPGRDLDDDIASAAAAERLASQIVASHGKPPAEWGKLLSALGKQSSTDMKASLIALHNLSGAPVTALSLTARGQTTAITPVSAAPPNLAATVGAIMGPPA